ncbi:hypothetical protein CARUB_v10016531mg [Capsella rubella]|uniref:Uncharacterized protein n=1 Tax=Capsella rubella TaxID=81985 RepID=R0ESZ9_9BRAS|nr:hypothetical protein CARUB_v10016531mg [Capsella rubella]
MLFFSFVNTFVVAFDICKLYSISNRKASINLYHTKKGRTKLCTAATIFFLGKSEKDRLVRRSSFFFLSFSYIHMKIHLLLV